MFFAPVELTFKVGLLILFAFVKRIVRVKPSTRSLAAHAAPAVLPVLYIVTALAVVVAPVEQTPYKECATVALVNPPAVTNAT